MLIDYVTVEMPVQKVAKHDLLQEPMTDVFLPGSNGQVIMLYQKTEAPAAGKRGSRRSDIRRRQYTAVVFDFDTLAVEEISLVGKDTLQVLK